MKGISFHGRRESCGERRKCACHRFDSDRSATELMARRALLAESFAGGGDWRLYQEWTGTAGRRRV